MAFFVIFKDGHYENGDHGMIELFSEDQVERFINERLKTAKNPNIADYTVIKGQQIQVFF